MGLALRCEGGVGREEVVEALLLGAEPSLSVLIVLMQLGPSSRKMMQNPGTYLEHLLQLRFLLESALLDVQNLGRFVDSHAMGPANSIRC